MQITHKTMAALLAVFVALLAGAAFILDRAVRPQFEQLEATLHERNQARVAANLAAIAEDIRARVMDYSNWDDTYSFVAGRNSAYTNDLTDAWFADYGIDLAIFANNDGRILWSRRRSETGLAADPATAAGLLAEVSRTPAGNEDVGGVVWLDGLGPVMVGAHRILRSDGSGPPRGWVIMGRRISDQALYEQTQLHVEIISSAAASSVIRRQIAALGDSPVRSWSSEDTLSSLRALHDVSGALSGVVLTTQAREVLALGDRSIATALVLITGLFVAAAAALWLLLRALIIRRVERLERHFNGQSAALTPMQRAESGDEIGRLTSAYNRLVSRLRDSAQREHAAVLEREAAASANRMKSDFLANMSHQLREPMDAIIGYAELVREELEGKVQGSIILDLTRICDAARRQLSLVDEIFDLSKLEAGRLELKCESFKVSEVVASAVKLAAPIADAQQTVILVEAEGDLGAAYSDRRRLRQCVTGVLSNACRLSAGGQVRLRVRRERTANGDELVFEIRDDGVALTPAQLARAFEPFAELDVTLARRLGGAGLGLAITRKMMALLGGRLDAKVLGDRGCEFVLVAPALCDEPSNAADARRAAA